MRHLDSGLRCDWGRCAGLAFKWKVRRGSVRLQLLTRERWRGGTSSYRAVRVRHRVFIRLTSVESLL